MMLCESALAHGVMEGNGAYNKHAKLPAGGATLAVPFLEKAAREVSLDPWDGPVVIADYGSSQGKNSLAPMRTAIENVRSRIGPRRPISVFHIDQPSDDFNTLFELLDADPDRYTLHEPDVFPCAIGRSFYENVLPPDSVPLGLEFVCGRVPAPHSYAGFGSFRCTTRHGRRARRLRATNCPGLGDFPFLARKRIAAWGRLVIVLPARNDEGVTGFEPLMDHANAVLAEMVEDGALRADEREQMIFGCCPRRTCDLLAPFQGSGQFQDLTVESCDLAWVADSAWADYERDGNNKALATKNARFFRSVLVPSLALALREAHDAGQRRIFADRFEDGLKRRLADQPEPLHSFVQTMVLAKRDSAARISGTR